MISCNAHCMNICFSCWYWFTIPFCYVLCLLRLLLFFFQTSRRCLTPKTMSKMKQKCNLQRSNRRVVTSRQPKTLALVRESPYGLGIAVYNHLKLGDDPPDYGQLGWEAPSSTWVAKLAQVVPPRWTGNTWHLSWKGIYRTEMALKNWTEGFHHVFFKNIFGSYISILEVFETNPWSWFPLPLSFF